MRVAIVHYWLTSMRGGENVVEALCRIFPQADIFTHVYDPGKISGTIRRHKITPTFINSLPRAKQYYKHYHSCRSHSSRSIFVAMTSSSVANLGRPKG
jgi:hypothetical protein